MIQIHLMAMLAAAPVGPVVFGGTGTWYVMSRDGRVQERITEIAGSKLADLAVSPDGKTRAFIPWEKRELRLIREDWREPLVIPNDADVVLSPTFSEDGAWVYFVQNSLKPHSDGMPMRYAQIWRVASAGGPAKQLTFARGCHQFPTIAPGGRLLFTHATCTGGRGVGLIAPGKSGERLLVAQTEENGQALMHSSGTRIVFSRARPADTAMFVLDLNTRQERFEHVLKPGITTPRLAWAEDGESVLYQTHDAVWRLAPDGTHTLVLNLQAKDGAQ